MASKNKIFPLTLQSFDTAGLNGTYQAVSSSGIVNECFFLRIVNDSNRDVTVSYNGADDNDFIPMGTTLEVNAAGFSPDGVIGFANKTRVYVKGSAGGTGSVYVTGYYRD